MATKQIPQLPSTNISNDTDLLMTRQGSEDRAVTIEKVRNIGTEAGQSLEVSAFGVGGDAIPIDSLFPTNNADIITRGGVYQINGAEGVPVSQGEIHHTQTSNSSSTQFVIGEDEEYYARKKVGGIWKAWFLVSAANKFTMRTYLDVYQRSVNLADIPNRNVARDNLDVYSKLVVDGKMEKSSNLNDLTNADSARDNLGVYPKSVVDGKLTRTFNLSDLQNTTVARTNLEVYSKGECDSRYLNEASNLSDLDDVSAARDNLDVYSRAQTGLVGQRAYRTTTGTWTINGLTIGKPCFVVIDGSNSASAEYYVTSGAVGAYPAPNGFYFRLLSSNSGGGSGSSFTLIPTATTVTIAVGSLFSSTTLRLFQ